MFLTMIQKARWFGWKRIGDLEEALVSTLRSYESAGVFPYPESYQAIRRSDVTSTIPGCYAVN